MFITRRLWGKIMLILLQGYTQQLTIQDRTRLDKSNTSKDTMDKNSQKRYLSPLQLRDKRREKAKERQRKRRKARTHTIVSTLLQKCDKNVFTMTYI